LTEKGSESILTLNAISFARNRINAEIYSWKSRHKELLTSLTIEDTTYCGNIKKNSHMLIFFLIYTLLTDKIITTLKNQAGGISLEH
jgi:hypothetical protein